jgi:hypothetical protein
LRKKEGAGAEGALPVYWLECAPDRSLFQAKRGLDEIAGVEAEIGEGDFVVAQGLLGDSADASLALDFDATAKTGRNESGDAGE